MMDTVFAQGFSGAAVTVMLAAAFGGAWLLALRYREARIQALVAVLWSASSWLMVLAMLTRATDTGSVQFWLRCLHATAPVVPMALLWLGASYLPKSRAFWEMRLPLVLAFLAACWFAYVSGLAPLATDPANRGQVVLAAYFIFFAVAALVTMVVATRRLPEEEAPGLPPANFGAAIVISAVFSMVFRDSALALGGPWTSLTMLAAGLSILTIFVADLHLFVDLRLVAAELLVLLALGIFSGELLTTAGNWGEFGLHFIAFALLLAFGGLMTRSLVRDVRRLRENAELQEQLIRLNGRLIEADRQKTKFVSFVAHQLRSPLAGVHIYLNMARQGQFGPISEELSGVLETNMSVLDRLMRTTQTFLDVTKIELGKVDLVKVPVAAGDLTARVIKEMQPLAASKCLTLEANVDDALPPLTCDPAYIFHVLVNLVDNAIKYTKDGGVRIVFCACGDGCECRVIDTGMGLGPDDRDRLFKVFERGASAVNIEAEGAGLGLYVARQFVEAHGGRVFFESAGQGHGSTFGFTLPSDEVKSI